jgi:hypothetical protein
MPSFRRSLLVISFILLSALQVGELHARDENAKSHSPMPCGQTMPCGQAMFCGQAVSDGQPCRSLSHAGCNRPCTTRPVWCPDDYRPKCPPCLGPLRYCGTCACYRAKCAPCVCPPKTCGTCDCYAPKCPPRLKFPCSFPSFYQCPPPKCRSTLAAEPRITKPLCR